MLTSQQLLEEGIITNVKDPKQIQQVGIDLTVNTIYKVSGVGFIPKEGKTVLPTYTEIPWEEDGTATLGPGSYEIKFNEGCNFPKNVAGNIIHRSSVLRSGALLMSAEFDPSYFCDSIGSFMTVINPIKIEKGARLGQIVCHRTEVEADSYQGQWQGGKDRN